MTYEIKIKVKHECEYLEYATQAAYSQMYSLCNNKFDLIIINERLNEKQILDFKQQFSYTTTWKHIKSRDENVNYFLSDCLCDPLEPTQVLGILNINNCITQQPVMYQDGWEYHKFLCFDTKHLSDTIGDLLRFDRIEIVSLNVLESDLPFTQTEVQITDLLDILTSHQVLALHGMLGNENQIKPGYIDITSNVILDNSQKSTEKILRKTEVLLKSIN